MNSTADPILDALIIDFGNNYVFALDLLEDYRRDPGALDASWRLYFDRLTGAAGEVPKPISEAAPAAPPAAPSDRPGARPRSAPETIVETRPTPAEAAPSPVPSLSVVRTTAPLARDAVRSLSTPLLPGDIANPMRGGALRLSENMEASLFVPTATSVREMAVRPVEENRRLLNKHRASSGASRISFTHLVAWALLRALDTFPRLNDAFAIVDDRAHRVQRGEVRLGVAVDVEKKSGERTLLVPNIKGANGLDFVGFLVAFDDVVARVRRGAITPDDFLGTTVTLTNPGTVGTTSSAPRLMPGQGLIVATGSLDYPAEYRAMVPRTLSLLGISKVLTVTSTYDHRIIQGAESGLFLARIEDLLRGADGFYERIFDDLGLPHRPIRWETDAAPGLFGGTGNKEEVEKQARVLQLINAYRVRGHLVADLDPLDSRRAPHVELDPATYGLTLWDLDRDFITNGALGQEQATLREILEAMRETYCGSIGVEYMGMQDTERKRWLQARMESTRNRTPLAAADRVRILEKLVEAESFEGLLHARFIGHKRFSLEGVEALIPLLDTLLNGAAHHGVREVVMGMSHRGRLNVLANVVGKPLARVFSEFEDVDPESTQGSGDVKYHLGAKGVHRGREGESVVVTLAPNPSHLEFVNPVVEGMVRAKQDALGDRGLDEVLPLLLHGDAAFAGQGVVAETLNLCGLEGYKTGGTVHVVVNNQIGFTTLPEDARSSTYCTDVAKMVQAPIFHVNGEDPEAVVHVARLALEWRHRYKHDVVIDLVGYRRWGHNEGDEPSYTQPLMYAKIKSQRATAHVYGEALIRDEVLTREEWDTMWAEKKARLEVEGEPGQLASIARRTPREPAVADATALRGRLRTTLEALSRLPAGFEVHPKLHTLLRKRAELLEGKSSADWATAEQLAWGTLLLEGLPVRLSGQDSSRGTFSQRHAVFFDRRTAQEHCPLSAIAPTGVRFEVHDSLLSEAAAMGFEVGYAVAEHDALVMWEAQFGDFANGAQVIIDQFLAASEQKWGQPTGLVLLLPHGHEGQGPEHSSARIERFLVLCAEENMRVAMPSTPASYFHLLRRQGRDPVEKPLIVMTPKSLLRHKRCLSSLDELAAGSFLEVLDDETADPQRVRRVVLTSGKLYFDLLEARETTAAVDVALVRLEQFYPFPAEQLSAVLVRHHAAEIVWAQEEPRNMGALRFIREQFLDGAVPGLGERNVRYVGRPASASPAGGSHRLHVIEQEAILAQALGP
jgi:2-oxoglutarate dehydrogenase E1 component